MIDWNNIRAAIKEQRKKPQPEPFGGREAYWPQPQVYDLPEQQAWWESHYEHPRD